MPRGTYPGQPLSPRDLETLQGLADGLSNKELGRRLYITEDSANARCVVLFKKLGVNTRGAAVAVGYERGILTGHNTQPRPPSIAHIHLVAAHLHGFRKPKMKPDPGRTVGAAMKLLGELMAAGWRGPADA